MFKLSIVASMFLISFNPVKAMEAAKGIESPQKIKVFASNCYYEASIKMEIGVKYKDASNPLFASFTMQKSIEESKPCLEISNAANISEIIVTCLHNRALIEKDDQLTLVAATNFKTTTFNTLKSLSLQLNCQEIIVNPSYNLPLSFSATEIK